MLYEVISRDLGLNNTHVGRTMIRYLKGAK